MPGISNFSKEELAGRLFAAVKAEADYVRILKSALESIADFEAEAEEDLDEIAAECVHIAKVALRKIGESAY